MLRKERVWNTLNNLCRQHITDEQLLSQVRVGFTTVQVADILELDRANTSRDLNQLVEEGRAVKLCGKPVLYLERSFLEERLGMAVSQTRFTNSSLSEILQLRSRIAAQSHKIATDVRQKSGFGTAPISNPRPRPAVRWLDLPDEDTLIENTARSSSY